MISQMVMLSILVNLRTNYTEALWCMVRMNTTLQGADKSDAYYFQIEAFNANGISERTSVMKSE